MLTAAQVDRKVGQVNRLQHTNKLVYLSGRRMTTQNDTGKVCTARPSGKRENVKKTEGTLHPGGQIH